MHSNIRITLFKKKKKSSSKEENVEMNYFPKKKKKTKKNTSKDSFHHKQDIPKPYDGIFATNNISETVLMEDLSAA